MITEGMHWQWSGFCSLLCLSCSMAMTVLVFQVVCILPTVKPSILYFMDAKVEFVVPHG